MDKNYELFLMAASAVRDVNAALVRTVQSGSDLEMVAYCGAELAKHANKAQMAQKMLKEMVQIDDSELYTKAWEHVVEGHTNELTVLFVNDARKEK